MSAPLLQFKAGRALRQGDSNTVIPQPGRGLVYLQEEDGLLHFYYKDLDADTVVDDLILFPGDATLRPAAHDRVHVLQFHSSSARHFYWHQDVELDPQEFSRRAAAFNELIGAPADADDADDAIETEALSAAPASDDVAMTSTAPGPPAASVGDAPGLGNAAQLAQLQNILAGLGSSSSNPTHGGGPPEFTLPDVLPASAAQSLIASLPDSSLSALAAFLPTSSSLLPTSTPTEQRASLLRAVASPEFRRSLASLDRALRTGATGPLVTGGLGLPPRAALGPGEFLEEVQRRADDERERGRSGSGSGSGPEEQQEDRPEDR